MAGKTISLWFATALEGATYVPEDVFPRGRETSVVWGRQGESKGNLRGRWERQRPPPAHGRGVNVAGPAPDHPPILCRVHWRGEPKMSPGMLAAPLSSWCQEGGCVGPLRLNQAASDPAQPRQTPSRPLTGPMAWLQRGLGRQRGAQHPKAPGHPGTPARGWDGEESLREGEEGVKSPALPVLPPTPPASLLTLGGRE